MPLGFAHGGRGGAELLGAAVACPSPSLAKPIRADEKGNLAADAHEFRAALVANGAVVPLGRIAQAYLPFLSAELKDAFYLFLSALAPPLASAPRLHAAHHPLSSDLPCSAPVLTIPSHMVFLFLHFQLSAALGPFKGLRARAVRTCQGGGRRWRQSSWGLLHCCFMPAALVPAASVRETSLCPGGGGGGGIDR